MNWESFRATRHLLGLDGLRGVAVLLVVIWHAGPPHATEWLHGYAGVDLFFVLSGFLITTLCLRESGREGSVSLRGFYVRRVARILPLYLVALAANTIAVLFVLTDLRREFLAALPYHLAFMNEFAPHSLFDHSWSLGVEEKFYLAWPLLGFWLLRHRPRARTIVAIVAATTPFVIRLIIQLGGLPESWALPNESRWLYGGYSSILIGCLLAIALNERVWFERLAPILRRPLPIFVAFAICIVGLREWWWAQGLYPWVSGAVVGCVAISEARTVGWLHNRALRMTGTLSYGIYLFHVLVLAFITQAVGFTPAERPLNPVPLVLCAAISFPVAYLLHVVIERPAIAAGRRRASASSLPLDPAANPP